MSISASSLHLLQYINYGRAPQRGPAVPVFCQRGFACGETARPVIGPAFWVCRAKSGAAFRCAKPPCAVVRFAAMTSSPRTDVLACPAFALLSHSPTALLNTPALVAIRLHFAAAKPGWPVVAPAGGNVLATPFSLRSNVAPRSHPGACSHSVAFRSAKPRGRSSAPPGPMFCRPRHGCAAPGPQRQNPGPPRFQSGFFYAKTGGRSPPLSDGGALTKPENIILCASSCHPPRSPYPHCTLPHVRFSGIGQKKKPQRKTAAAVNTLYMSCKKTNVNPISFPIAFFLLKRFRSQMTIRLHGETNMYS